jgi:ABC-type transport system involved in cytochrome c biogenesis permease subunit
MNAMTRSGLAAVLLIVPVAIETLVRSDHLPLWAHGAFAASQLAGWALLLSVSRLLAARAGGSRWGSRLVQAACVLQLVFAVGYGITALVQGEPSEGIFVIFLLAFLALTAGGLTWGLRLVRSRRATPAGNGLLAVAILGFLAMALGMDPFHDIFLLSSYAAWIAVGLGTDRAASQTEEPALVSDRLV